LGVAGEGGGGQSVCTCPVMLRKDLLEEGLLEKMSGLGRLWKAERLCPESPSLSLHGHTPIGPGYQPGGGEDEGEVLPWPP